MASIILVGCGSSQEAARSGDGACQVRTRRFQLALEREGFLAEVFYTTGFLSDMKRLKELLARRSGLHGMVAISPFPAETAVMAGTRLPLWIDMNGMHAAEVQLTGGDYTKHRMQLARMLSLDSALLMRGDRFSTPSRRQRIAVLAELLLLGRLDAASLCIDPVSAVPHCVMPDLDTSLRSGRRRKDGDFLVISAGSFNRWFDHRTLFHAIEAAMARDPGIRFTAAGGPVPHSPGSWEEFGKMVAESQFRDRISMPGWLAREDLDRLFAEADAAVFADIPCPETEMGARTRALDWIAWGIPVVCTRGTEISEDIADEGLGLVVPQSSPGAMAEAILSLKADPGLSSAIAERQKSWGEGRGSMGEAFRPVVEWATCPQRLPTRPLGRAPIPGFQTMAYSMLLVREMSLSRGVLSALRKAFLRLRQIRARS